MLVSISDREIGGSGMTDKEREIDRVIKYIRSCRKAGIDTNITIDKRKNHFILNALEEVLQYHSIGTVEECREAIEKQKEKKSKHSGCYDNEGVWHEWNGINGKPYELCPNCGTNLCCEMPYDKNPKYCNECGQKLDWS